MDLVVTVPKWFWPEWIEEGELPGESIESDDGGWEFSVGWRKPPIVPGDRLYIVAHGRLRGYAPVTGLRRECDEPDGKWCIVRRGGAVAVTIDETIVGFRGWRQRWWQREDEKPFPDWMTAGVPDNQVAEIEEVAEIKRAGKV